MKSEERERKRERRKIRRWHTNHQYLEWLWSVDIRLVDSLSVSTSHSLCLSISIESFALAWVSYARGIESGFDRKIISGGCHGHGIGRKTGWFYMHIYTNATARTYTYKYINFCVYKEFEDWLKVFLSLSWACCSWWAAGWGVMFWRDRFMAWRLRRERLGRLKRLGRLRSRLWLVGFFSNLLRRGKSLGVSRLWKVEVIYVLPTILC